MYYDKLQLRIYNFIEKANLHLGDDNAFYYGGHFATGQLYKPDMLFVGINPGYESNKWQERPKAFEFINFEEVPCKYVEDFTLAKKVLNILLDGNATRLERCAETSLMSIFATPNVSILNNTLSHLSPELKKEHDDLTHEVVDRIGPKQVVCIGLTTFTEYLKCFGQDGYEVPVMKSFKSCSGKSDPVYYKYTVVRGTPVYGVLHLSGAQPSIEALSSLRKEFKEIWETIEQSDSKSKV